MFVTYLLYLISVILPFLLIIRTHNFWITQSTFYEQPDVVHLNEILVVIYTEKQTYTFGSTSELN